MTDNDSKFSVPFCGQWSPMVPVADPGGGGIRGLEPPSPSGVNFTKKNGEICNLGTFFSPFLSVFEQEKSPAAPFYGKLFIISIM